MKILSMFLLWLTCLTPGEAEKTFYRAFYQESALRRMGAAATSYGQAAEQALDADDEGLHVKALLGQARCLRALGRLEEAREQFVRVLELDPGNPEASTALEKQAVGAGIDPALALRIQALVQELGGEEREYVRTDLRRIGALAVPFLEEGLRSRDVGVVGGATNLLTLLGSVPAVDALRLGLTDPEVLFPATLVLQNTFPWNAATARFWEAGLTHEHVEVRRQAIRLFGTHFREVPADQFAAAVGRALADQDAEIRRHALGVSGDWTMLIEELRPFFRAELASERLRAIEIANWPSLTPSLSGELLEALQDRDAEVRAQAAKVLSDADPETVDGALLMEAGRIALSDEDLEVQAAGASILSRSKMPWSDPVRERVVELLRRLLVEPPSNPRQRDSLLELISSIREPGLMEHDLVDLYALAGHTPAGSGSRLARGIRRSILGRLRLLFADRVTGIWNLLVATMQATDDESGQELLLERVQKLLQGHPFRAPIQAGPRSFLLTAAGSQFPGVRRLAYHRLSGDLDPAYASLPHLLADLGAEEGNLSVAAFRVISQYPRAEFSEPARAFLKQQFELGEVNRQALQFYVKSAGSAAAPVLLDLLLHGRGYLRDPLIHHLSLLEGEQVVPDLLAFATRIRDPFQVVRQISNPDVLVRFVLALPAEQVSARLLKVVETHIPESALETLLFTAFDSADSDTQAEACRLAGLAAFESTLPKLTELLESDTYLVRNAADVAVRAIQERKYRRLTAELLGPAGKSAALERALNLIRSDDSVKRQGGALALGALGDPAAIPALLDLLEDGDASVRQSAVQALENLGRKPQAGGR